MNGLRICPVKKRRPTGLWRSGSGRASWVWWRRRVRLRVVVGPPLRIGKPIGASRPWWWWRWWPSWWSTGKSKRWLSPGWPARKPIRRLTAGWSAGKPKGHRWWDILVGGRWPPRRPSRRSGRRVVRVVVGRVVVAGVRRWGRGARGSRPRDVVGRLLVQRWESANMRAPGDYARRLDLVLRVSRRWGTWRV